MHTCEWEPIESAPRDGTRVLLYHGHADEPIVGGRWSLWDTTEVWVTDQGEGWLNPTHWMPLPKGPEIVTGNWPFERIDEAIGTTNERQYQWSSRTPAPVR